MTIITQPEPKKRGKYKVRHDKEGKERRTIDGIIFDSEKEAKRYWELKQLEKSGEIVNLDRQVNYSLDVNGIYISNYVADFVYEYPDGIEVVEDVKGHRTREYVIKKRLMKACHNIEVQEV